MRIAHSVIASVAATALLAAGASADTLAPGQLAPGQLAPGKPVGVKQAQFDRGTIVMTVGGLGLVAGLTLLIAGNKLNTTITSIAGGNGNQTVTGTNSAVTTTTTSTR